MGSGILSGTSQQLRTATSAAQRAATEQQEATARQRQASEQRQKDIAARSEEIKRLQQETLEAERTRGTREATLRTEQERLRRSRIADVVARRRVRGVSGRATTAGQGIENALTGTIRRRTLG